MIRCNPSNCSGEAIRLARLGGIDRVGDFAEQLLAVPTAERGATELFFP
jgi:hypothetical protein